MHRMANNVTYTVHNPNYSHSNCTISHSIYYRHGSSVCIRINLFMWATLFFASSLLSLPRDSCFLCFFFFNTSSSSELGEFCPKQAAMIYFLIVSLWFSRQRLRPFAPSSSDSRLRAASALQRPCITISRSCVSFCLYVCVRVSANHSKRAGK